MIITWQRQLPLSYVPSEVRRWTVVQATDSERMRWGAEVGKRHQNPARRAVAKHSRGKGANTDFETMSTISALVFLGVAEVKHQCRPATEEDLVRTKAEPPIKEPTGFTFGNQRFCELLVEVFGA